MEKPGFMLATEFTESDAVAARASDSGSAESISLVAACKGCEVSGTAQGIIFPIALPHGCR